MHDDRASAEELAALHAAVLRDHDQLVRMGPKRRSLRVARRLKQLHLSWLLIPWYLVLAAGLFLRPGSWRRLAADEEQAVGLYRRLSGKDPRVARAEVGRIVLQLGALDERLCLDEARPGAPGGADPGELEAAAGALVGYYLGGRRTDDELLDEVEAAWAEYEELTEQQLERAMDRKRVGRGRAGPMVDERVQAAADRYRTAWRRWFDRRVEDGSAAGPRAR
jgi:hypothetical protein